MTAYRILANSGIYSSLTYSWQGDIPIKTKRIFSEEISSLISNILSDPEARRREFSGTLLNFPSQTAIKTGTSNDYRDAWAIAYSSEFTAGAWMGIYKIRL